MSRWRGTPEEIETFVVEMYSIKEILGYREIAELVTPIFGRSIDKSTVGNILRKYGLTGEFPNLVEIRNPHGEADLGQLVVHLEVQPNVFAPQAEIEIRWYGVNRSEGACLRAFNSVWVGGGHIKDLIRRGVYSFPVALKIEGKEGFHPLSRGLSGYTFNREDSLTSGRYLVQATVYGPGKHYGTASFDLADDGPELADFCMHSELYT